MKKRIILITAVVTAVITLSIAGITYSVIESSDDPSGITHPRYSYYLTLFNAKCTFAHPDKIRHGKVMEPAHMPTNQEILALLYVTGIPKDEARELFSKAKNRWEENDRYNQWGTQDHCIEETKIYHDKALRLLENLPDIEAE